MSLHSEGTLDGSEEVDGPRVAGPRPRRGLPGIRLPSTRGPLVRAIWVAIGLACLALAAAAWFLVAWRSAADDPALARGRAREAVLDRAAHVAGTLNTEDTEHPEKTVASWQKVTTGRLHEKYTKAVGKYATAIRKAGNVSDAKVTGKAVRSLDASKGTARLLVTIYVTVQHGKKKKTKHERLAYDMASTPGGWKAQATHTIEGR
jgi:hypothetical protein